MTHLLPINHSKGNTLTEPRVTVIRVLPVRDVEMMDILSNTNVLSGTGDMIIWRK